jgi:hypothetical protein
MVADPFPIDQHFVKNPSDLYENVLDDLILDLENDVIEEGKFLTKYLQSSLFGISSNCHYVVKLTCSALHMKCR